MDYIYIIQSTKDKSKYIGISCNIKKRLKNHNLGHVKYTAPKRPYNLVWYCAFTDKLKAFQFEKYLKSGSGIAFTNRPII